MWAEGIYPISELPHVLADMPNKHLLFKPGVGDKMIFQKLIDKHIGYLQKEYEPGSLDPQYKRVSMRLMGVEILENDYYPQYSWFDKKKLEDVRD